VRRKALGRALRGEVTAESVARLRAAVVSGSES
jgi:hypothetical protein